MEHSFWHSKWQKNEIGFHEPEGNALLVKYSSFLIGDDSPSSSSSRIFVPLCGKTRDIGWLLAQGCEVVGAELSEVAITQLFEELGVEPTISTSTNGKVYTKDGLTIFVGDIFKLTSSDIGDVTGVYDRAALVALPSPLREQYSAHLIAITQCAPQLIISFDYDQNEMAGPPFSVNEKTVDSLYSADYNIQRLERSVLEGGLKGKVDADNLVFALSAK
ncbi:thiopurine S-methyltransferase family protein [Alteromonas macleodii str. 'Black Sea 11']|uniref:thiopurine S-methyltransferase n=1 Tax=Alteromonas abrolhosensis TaxID=1892904 RepID=UPI000286F2B1|nr:thiopurine S-methyltransferase family protein [Alteromonas macleodii str. 'Black Sea 11']NKW90777.1 thiopurine S-methyltransferase [Alteromonadaceae bacterium A_SAG4]NKX04284.1 thiopurine S-methyltransferase [Alteromonadaceae bacterium A_SAG6]NKX36241.1 thiopurine S-methyltransferase [Alteromonadaceae bacterium A_SAG3]NKX69124.1 thiopurine S-methyltransferase [Alteromonadaceae bacterium A_SAG7]